MCDATDGLIRPAEIGGNLLYGAAERRMEAAISRSVDINCFNVVGTDEGGWIPAQVTDPPSSAFPLHFTHQSGGGWLRVERLTGSLAGPPP